MVRQVYLCTNITRNYLCCYYDLRWCHLNPADPAGPPFQGHHTKLFASLLLWPQVLLHEPRQSVQQVCDTGRSISPATQPDPGAACPSQPVCPGVPSLACPASPAASFRQSSDAGCHRQHHSHFATLAASSSTPQPLCNSSGFIVNTTATLQL